MRTRYSFGLVALLVLLGGAASAAPGDKILVPGDPALTQDMVDKDIGSWELVLGLKLTAAQRTQFQQARINDWKRAEKPWKDEYLKDHAARTKEAALGDVERSRIRDEEQPLVLARMRRSPNDAIYRILLPVYEGQVLVPGNPALTRGDFDREASICEWLLDLWPTPAERKEYQDAFIAAWKKQTRAQQAANLKATANWYARLSKASPADRAAERAIALPANLKRFAVSKAEDDKWLLAAFEAAHKPGSDANPILAKGKPPLTLDMLNDYFDYLEWSCDLGNMGGWPQGRLKALQELIIADWAKADAAGRDAFRADLRWWKETFPTLNTAERDRAKSNTARVYVNYVERTASENKARAAWVQGFNADLRLEGHLEAARHQAVMDAIGRIGGQTPVVIPSAPASGGYGYRYANNPRTGQVEFKFGWWQR